MSPQFLPPSEVRAYAKALGWKLLDEAIKDRLYVLQNPEFPRRQLVFPMDAGAPDFSDVMLRIAEKLADIYCKDTNAVITEILTARDDTLRFRVISTREDDPSLPLPYVVSSMAGAQQLLLASACTILKPQAHHPRLSRAEAQQLVESARFRHTEHGSFVLKVSCPIMALDVQAPLFPDEVDAPFVRRATLALETGVRKIVDAIEVDNLDSFVDQTKRAARPLVSSNLCEALTRFYDEDSVRSVDIGISWAPTQPAPSGAKQSLIRIPREYFPRIEEVRRELRATEGHHDDTFVGTVERLDGDLEEDGRRSGEVILSLLLKEGETVRARTNLDADTYAKADMAHMTSGAYVRVKGRLNPGRQPRVLNNVSQFDLILPGAG